MQRLRDTIAPAGRHAVIPCRSKRLINDSSLVAESDLIVHPTPLRLTNAAHQLRTVLSNERSDSKTNERASPTLRIVGDPQAQVYGSSPFPTKPSQILSPREYKEQGSTFGPEVDVSRGRSLRSETKHDNAEPSFLARAADADETPNIRRNDHVPTV